MATNNRLKPVPDPDEALREHIEVLKQRQEGRRAYQCEIQALIDLRDVEIKNFEARLSMSSCEAAGTE